MNLDILDEEDVERIALAKVCEHIKDDEWCEDGSVRMDIKHLNKVVGDLKMDIRNLQDQYHQTTVSQINRLWDETRQLTDAIVQIQKIVRDLVDEADKI